MSYPEKYYSQAQQEIDRRRLDNGREADRRDREVRARIPEASDIIKELAGTTSRLADIIFSHSENADELIEQTKQRNLELQKKLADSLVKYGYTADYLDEIYTCKKCRDTGIYEGRRCSCFNDILKGIAARELSSEISASKYSFDNFDLSYYSKTEKLPGRNSTPYVIMSKTLEKCKRYAEDFHLPYNGLIMYGATGLGKTHLSIAITSAVLQKGYNAVYFSAPDLLHKLESARFNRNEQDDDVLTVVKECDLLVLDDLGSEFSSQFTVSCVYDIINTRMNFERPTIINTNLSVEKLKEIYNDRIVSRITSMNKILFEGSDIRNIKK